MGKPRKFMALGPPENPQLACRKIQTHAFCMISRIADFLNWLIYKDLFAVSNLAQRSQHTH
jgi:hypothetical protein